MHREVWPNEKPGRRKQTHTPAESQETARHVGTAALDIPPAAKAQVHAAA